MLKAAQCSASHIWLYVFLSPAANILCEFVFIYCGWKVLWGFVERTSKSVQYLDPGQYIREGACVILGWSSLWESGTPWQFVLGDLQTDSASEHPPDNLKAWSQPVCYSDDYECGDWLMADDGNNDDDDDDDDRLMGCWWGIMRVGFEDRGCKIFVQPALLGCRGK